MTIKEKVSLVGTTVRIRTWDSLAEEYGINGAGHICVDGRYIRHDIADEVCGKFVMIKAISPDGDFFVTDLKHTVLEPMLDFNYLNNEVEEIEDVASDVELGLFLSEG